MFSFEPKSILPIFWHGFKMESVERLRQRKRVQGTGRNRSATFSFPASLTESRRGLPLGSSVIHSEKTPVLQSRTSGLKREKLHRSLA